MICTSSYLFKVLDILATFKKMLYYTYFSLPTILIVRGLTSMAAAAVAGASVAAAGTSAAAAAEVSLSGAAAEAFMPADMSPVSGSVASVSTDMSPVSAAGASVANETSLSAEASLSAERSPGSADVASLLAVKPIEDEDSASQHYFRNCFF